MANSPRHQRLRNDNIADYDSILYEGAKDWALKASDYYGTSCIHSTFTVCSSHLLLVSVREQPCRS